MYTRQQNACEDARSSVFNAKAQVQHVETRLKAHEALNPALKAKVEAALKAIKELDSQLEEEAKNGFLV